MSISRLGLGTVQFGLDYGISNTCGMVSPAEARRMLALAHNRGFTFIDTAPTYGDSELAVGKGLPDGHEFRMITKTPVVPGARVTSKDGETLVTSLKESLKRLGQERIYGLLIHHAGDLIKPGGEHLVEALERLREDDLVEKVGVSVYNAREIDAILPLFSLGLIQLPINVLDQRLIHSGHLAQLRSQGIEIHARSCFLQGLLLMNPQDLPPFFAPVRNRLQAIRRAFGNTTPVAGCLAFLLARPEIGCIVVGATSVEQLSQIAAAAEAPAHDIGLDLAIPDERFLNPAQWPKGIK